MKAWNIGKQAVDALAGLAMIVASVYVAVAAHSLGNASPAKPSAAPVAPPALETKLVGTVIKASDLPTSDIAGERSANLVIMEFSDFQCPFCGRYASETLGAVQAEFVKTGRATYVFRHLPLSAIHPMAMGAAQAAECAQAQGKFWEMHDSLFAHQESLGPEQLRARGEELGLDSAAFKKCMSGTRPSQIDTDIKIAATLGIAGTPSFVIGKRMSNGDLHVTAVLSGAVDAAAFRAAIDRS